MEWMQNINTIKYTTLFLQYVIDAKRQRALYCICSGFVLTRLIFGVFFFTLFKGLFFPQKVVKPDHSLALFQALSSNHCWVWPFQKTNKHTSKQTKNPSSFWAKLHCSFQAVWQPFLDFLKMYWSTFM